MDTGSSSTAATRQYILNSLKLLCSQRQIAYRVNPCNRYNGNSLLYLSFVSGAAKLPELTAKCHLTAATISIPKRSKQKCKPHEISVSLRINAKINGKWSASISRPFIPSSTEDHIGISDSVRGFLSYVEHIVGQYLILNQQSSLVVY